MQSVAPPASSSVRDRITASYRRLQDELIALVKETDAPVHVEELIRHAIDGSIKLQDAIILAHLIKLRAPARILEIGSFIGFSTRWLLEMSEPFGTTVVSVDPGIRHRAFDQPAEVLRRFTARFGSRLVQRCGFFCEKLSGDCYFDYEHYPPVLPRPQVDAIMRSRPLLHSRNLGEGPFDFIFIDGDHSAEAVKCNFTEALALLNPGGSIAFHDAITWPEVARALEDIARCHADRGEVEIHGGDFHPDARACSCDGIGVFRLR